jgi:hypothetical protein
MAKARTPRNGSKKNDSTQTLQSVAEPKRNIIPINLEDEIRQRAYEIYEERNGAPGDQHEDWLRAEREVLARYQQTA